MFQGNANEDRFERTFAFIDLSGFTRFTDNEGDKAALDEIIKFRLFVREIASSKGLRIAKWLGDGAMLVAVEPEIATEAIMEMQGRMEALDEKLGLRAGLASGPVLMVDGEDYLGHAVNLAARLCDLAQPGEVLATKKMMTSLMVNTPFEPAAEREIDGLEETVQIVRLKSPT
tara:strand:+ start:446 stop:964 length:519 start_codon:yes stop_codon:yes gene_type:complete